MPWPCLEVTWQLGLPVLGPLPLRLWVGCAHQVRGLPRAESRDPALRAGPEDCRVLAPGATMHPLSGAELGHPQGSSQNLGPLGAGLHACPCFPWPLWTRAPLVPRPCPPQKQAELRVEPGDRADQGSSVRAISLRRGWSHPCPVLPGRLMGHVGEAPGWHRGYGELGTAGCRQDLQSSPARTPCGGLPTQP